MLLLQATTDSGCVRGELCFRGDECVEVLWAKSIGHRLEFDLNNGLGGNSSRSVRIMEVQICVVRKRESRKNPNAKFDDVKHTLVGPWSPVATATATSGLRQQNHHQTTRIRAFS